MTKRNLFLGGGAAVLGLAVVALASTPAKCQDSSEAKLAQVEEKLERAQERLADMQARLQDGLARLARGQEALEERLQDRAVRASQVAADRATQEVEQNLQRVLQAPDGDTGLAVLAGDEGASWLGVESQDVNADKAKELKLPAERGVLLGRIVPDSPAAKAGLKENDVITEINGQRVEGEAQFRRMIREIPAGRTVQLTVWRDGRAQSVSVTLGKAEERSEMWLRPGPNSYSFQLPNVEIPDVQVYPDGDFDGFNLLAGGRPRLGIDAEDLSGQFGAYFGAPDGEGVLVREVSSGSPAEKAGIKSGDVITSVDGERIRSLGDLREKLAAKREEKTVKLGVLRNKSEMSVTIELPPPPSKTPHTITHRTNI
jgi:serine protease Do